MAGVAEIHTQATLTPSKLEVMRAWLPGEPWFSGDASDLAVVGQFRFVNGFDLDLHILCEERLLPQGVFCRDYFQMVILE